MLNQTGLCYCDQVGVENPNKMSIVVSKVTVIVENSDGTHMKSESIMPHDIADHLHAQVLGWGRHWITTFDEHDEYREEEKKFVSKLRNENK